jgi:hypothetical protein
MTEEQWSRARLVSVERHPSGRVKLLIEIDTDPHSLADSAAVMLRYAADEARRPGPRSKG